MTELNTEIVHVDVRPHIAAIAKPGDTILIGFAHQVSDEEVEAIDANFRPFIDQGIKVGFLDQVTSMVVLRTEDVNGAPLKGRS